MQKNKQETIFNKKNDFESEHVEKKKNSVIETSSMNQQISKHEIESKSNKEENFRSQNHFKMEENTNNIKDETNSIKNDILRSQKNNVNKQSIDIMQMKEDILDVYADFRTGNSQINIRETVSLSNSNITSNNCSSILQMKSDLTEDPKTDNSVSAFKGQQFSITNKSQFSYFNINYLCN